MGRAAGVTAAETRERLLSAAAGIFAQGVAAPMRAYIGERAERLGGLVRLAMAGGELDPSLSPDALAHLCPLLARVVTGLAPIKSTAQTGTT